jgi:high-affinity iron transporter
VGSALFAVFPGVLPGDYLGSSLVSEEPLTRRIEALQAAIGSLYPALARGDWNAVRTGASAWSSLWEKQRQAAGPHARTLDSLNETWVRTLAAEAPSPELVRSAQAGLLRELAAWQKAVETPRGTATDLVALKTDLEEVSRALSSGDAASARQRFSAFQQDWLSKESLVRNLDAGAYGFIELKSGEVRRALRSDPPGPAAASGVQAVSERLGALASPKAFGAWDAGFLLCREGLEALLVLAALLAFLDRTGQKNRASWVWSGAGLGLGASVGVAVAISILMTGLIAASASTLVEGLTGLVAAVLMLTFGAWLHRKASVKNWNLWLRDQMEKVGDSPWALGLLAFLAVLREGSETVIFFWGLAGSLSTGDLLLGIAGALAVLAVLGVLLIGFSQRLPLRWFFPLATALIYFLAVKILGQSLGSLQSSGWVSATPLGFGAPFDAVGFIPTWETALPQVILTVILAALVLVPLVRNRRETKKV